MGSRKDCLKKALGITEYPWSSDDEEERPAPELPPRTNREPRPSVADMPGTSGVQQQSEETSPATARRIQARMDRDLFWSILNNTPRPNNGSVPPPRSRATGPSSLCPRSTSSTLRSRMEIMPDQRNGSRRTDRPSSSSDVQRILAFKKLTRSLQNLAASKTTCSTTQHASTSTNTPRVPRPQDRAQPPRTMGSQGGPSRSSLFTPTYQVNREGGGYGYNPPWRRSLPTYPTNLYDLDDMNLDEVPSPSGEPWHYTHTAPEPLQSSSTSNLNNLLQTTFTNVPNVPTDGNVLLPDEAIADIPVPPSRIQKVEPADEPNDNHDEEHNEEPPHDESGSGARLIEEVVEVDAPDGGENNNNPPPPGVEPDEEPTEPPAENNTTAETVNADQNTQTAPQDLSTYHGLKRKRESNDESNDLFSVQEFNQSLLRLLECPVCLEWMEPPITQCRRGHLVCSRCRARLAACPVCRTPFSSVRNRAMEGVAEMLRYPCRHGCGKEVRLRRRGPHESSCGSRRYHCPAPPCARHPPLPRDQLAHHFQCKHLPILKIGNKHKFSMKVNSEQHDTWLIMAMDEYFHLRVDVDIRTWGVIVYVAYIGPKKNARFYSYVVTVQGQHSSRKLVYTRSTHSDLESSSLNVSRQDCFHLTLDQALNFLRFRNKQCEPDKILDFDVEITKWEPVDEPKDDSES